MDANSVIAIGSTLAGFIIGLTVVTMIGQAIVNHIRSAFEEPFKTSEPWPPPVYVAPAPAAPPVEEKRKNDEPSAGRWWLPRPREVAASGIGLIVGTFFRSIGLADALGQLVIHLLITLIISHLVTSDIGQRFLNRLWTTANSAEALS